MSRPSNKTAHWELTALIAALVIVVSLPVYYFLVVKGQHETVIQNSQATFVGSVECQDCHNNEYDSWQDSHHDLAMDIATETSVLGGFR